MKNKNTIYTFLKNKFSFIILSIFTLRKLGYRCKLHIVDIFEVDCFIFIQK